MKPSQNSVDWMPFTDNVKKDHAIVDSELIEPPKNLIFFSRLTYSGWLKSKDSR